MHFKDILALIRAIRADEKGVTAMEYGVIAAATIVAISAALLSIGPRMTVIFGSVKTALQAT